jgi:glycosyltransferase involved in cell wall biosynthesis
MKLLLVTMYFPPSGGGGVQRPLKLAMHLPLLGIETHVLAPDDSKWVHSDPELQPPTQAWIHRARYVGPRGRIPTEELYGRTGLDRLSRQAQLFSRRLLVPDENVPWNVTAIPAALRIVHAEGIDTVLTTSPPSSVHLVGAAVKRALGVRWVADLRDSVVAQPERRIERRLVRLKEQGHRHVARLVARRADAIVAVTPTIADEMRSLRAGGRVEVIANGVDFDDFAGLEHKRSDRFRITHTGSFWGKRDPRPFLTAVAESRLDVRARFVGDFRKSDRDWAAQLGLGDRLELIPFAPRRRALELQRDSEINLLLLPDVGERGRDVPSGKLYEYLAAGRPILAAVPPNGTAADLVREAGAGVIVPPDDVRALREALVGFERRWRTGDLPDTPLPPELRQRISRQERAAELADLLQELP